MDFSPSPPLSDEERIHRIGELICKAILAARFTAADAGPSAADTLDDRVAADPVLEEPERRIIEYLRRHTEAPPGEMCRMLNLSRSTTYRALQRLVNGRRVVPSGGRTSAACYRLRPADPSQN